MQRRHYIVAFVVAALSTAYTLYGFVNPTWPVWGLFRNFDRFEYTLIDANGQSYRLGDYVLRRAYVTCDQDLVFLIGGWLVESGHAQAPLWGRVRAWTDDGPPETREFVVRLVDGRASILPFAWKAGQ
jgi:hypothetical protein